jgi:hypothetical protein
MVTAIKKSTAASVEKWRRKKEQKRWENEPLQEKIT